MLAVDIGNTTIKICRFAPDGEILWRDTHPTAEISFEFVRSFFKSSGASRVVIASVVRPVNVFFEKGLVEAGAQSVRIVDPARDCIIENCLATPQTTGTDRLLSARAARALHPGQPVIVVQAGTALTVDAVSADGVFAGGYILPGPQMWLDSLSSAAQLPYFPPSDLDWSANAPGDSTRSAILNGAVTGLRGAALAAIQSHLRLQNPNNPPVVCDAPFAPYPVPVLVTGGWGQDLASVIGATYSPDLVLRGLFDFSRTCHANPS